MATIHLNCFADEYHRVLKLVRDGGFRRTPRGLPTRELGFTTIVITDPDLPTLPVGSGRKLSTSVAAVETLQVVAGESQPELLLRVAPQFAEYMEPEAPGSPAHFHGAYGRRIADQAEQVIRKLKSDPDTRQAVITIWNPELDNLPGKRDYPCTVALGFSIVHGRLRMTTLMRSNDAWLGLPYDVFVFTQLQQTIANALQVDVGHYYHTAWSLHLYERNLDSVDRVGPTTYPLRQPKGLNVDNWDTAKYVASLLMKGERFNLDSDPGGGKLDWLWWYVDALAPFVGSSVGEGS